MGYDRPSDSQVLAISHSVRVFISLPTGKGGVLYSIHTCDPPIVLGDGLFLTDTTGAQDNQSPDQEGSAPVISPLQVFT